MRKNSHLKGRHASAGQSMIELAIILPMLLILVLGVVDFGRAILFNNILVNMSREGANLAARTPSTPSPFRNIIKALNRTAAPLDMGAHGMVYIFRIKGVTVGGTVEAHVEELYRSPNSDGYELLASKLWNNCSVWNIDNGKCTSFPSTLAISGWTLPLADGDEVRVAEIIYRYTPLTTYVMQNTVDLYSSTVL